MIRMLQWLETTKENNVEIFNKVNYHLIGTKNESSVKYYILTNEKAPINV
jgi:hypothetical protein